MSTSRVGYLPHCVTQSTPYRLVEYTGRFWWHCTRGALNAVQSVAAEKTLAARLWTTISDAKKEDREFMLPLVQRYPDLIRYAPPSLRDSFLFMGPLLETHPELIQYASEHLQVSPLMYQAAAKNPELVEHAGEKLLDNPKFIEPLIKGDTSRNIPSNPGLIRYASERLRSDFPLMQFVIQQDPLLVTYAASSLLDDLTFMQEVITRNSDLVTFASNRLKNDRTFMSQVINLNPTLVVHTSSDLRKDAQFMTLVIHKNPSLVSHADPSLKNNADFMTQALKLDPRLISEVATTLKDDETFMTSAIAIDSNLAKHASFRLKQLLSFQEAIRRVELMELALTSNLSLIRHMEDSDILGSQTFMTQAILKDPSLYTYASKELKKNGRFLVDILTAHPSLVKEINPLFTNIPKLMQAVLDKDLSQLPHVGTKLRDDADFMAPFVVKDPSVLEHSFPTLQEMMLQHPADLSLVVSVLDQTDSSILQETEGLLDTDSPYRKDSHFRTTHRLLRFLLLIAKNKPEIVRHLPSALLKDEVFMFSLIINYPRVIPLLPPVVWKQTQLMSVIASRQGGVNALSPAALDELKKHWSFVVAAAASSPEFLNTLEPDLLQQHYQHPLFVARLAIQDPRFLSQIPADILTQHKRNPDFIIAMAKHDVQFLSSLDATLLDNSALMIPLVSEVPAAFPYASKRLRKRDNLAWMQPCLDKICEKGDLDREYRQTAQNALQTLAIADYHLLQWIPAALKEDRSFMWPIAKEHRQALKYLPNNGNLLQDVAFLRELALIHGWAEVFKYAQGEAKKQAGWRTRILTVVSRPERRAQTLPPPSSASVESASESTPLAEVVLSDEDAP